jgi:hypothetical protein
MSGCIIASSVSYCCKRGYQAAKSQQNTFGPIGPVVRRQTSTLISSGDHGFDPHMGFTFLIPSWSEGLDQKDALTSLSLCASSSCPQALLSIDGVCGIKIHVRDSYTKYKPKLSTAVPSSTGMDGIPTSITVRWSHCWLDPNPGLSPLDDCI